MILGMASVLAVTAWLGSTVTVDDDGPADFPSIVQAIQAAADGDVIVVAPGTYAGFATSKALSILGASGAGTPVIASPIEIIDASRFTLAGFVTEPILAIRVAGRLTLDACLVQGALGAPALRVSQCSQVLLSRLTIVGGERSLGLMIEASFATVVGSTITGGDAGPPGIAPAYGGMGVAVRTGSTCVLVASNVTGGDSGFDVFGAPGIAGTGLRAETGTLAILRGGPQHTIASGKDYPGPPGKAIDAAGVCTVVWSGMSITGGVYFDQPGNVVIPASPEPWLEVLGSDSPGQTRFIELHGGNGASALLFASLAPGAVTHPALELPLWFSPGSLVSVLALSTQGIANPISLPVAVPATPAIAGLELEVQAVFPQLPSTATPGKLVVTNAASLVPRT